MTGEQLLIEFTRENFRKKVYRFTDRIYFFVGYGNTNATAILAHSSIILIDALDCDQYAQELKEELARISPYPVKTIIYTNQKYSHTGGAGVFADTVKEVIGFDAQKSPLKYSEMLTDVLHMRKIFARGYGLSNEDAISQGIGPREGLVQEGADIVPLKVTTLYTGDSVERNIDGISLKLIRTPGETSDAISVLLRDENILAVGDNYYGVFPHLYSVLGSSYLDVGHWADVLDRILDLDPEIVLPAHTEPVIGKIAVQEQLGLFRDVLEYVLIETLECMNEGLGLNETAEKVKLPDRFKTAYLGEYYSLVQWAVKTIYTGYMGWFDGSPAHLIPASDQEYRQTMIDLIGVERLKSKIKDCLFDGNYQMALQLNWFLQDDQLQKIALKGRAVQVANANARHYYLACAKEL